MDHALLVGPLHGVGQDGHQCGGLLGRHGLARQAGRQAPAPHEFHGEEGAVAAVADFVDLDDVGVLEEGHDPRLAQKPRPLLLRPRTGRKDGLQGHDAVQGDLPGLVDDGHPAAAHFLEDLVSRHAGPCLGRGRRRRFRRGGQDRRRRKRVFGSRRRVHAGQGRQVRAELVEGFRLVPARLRGVFPGRQLV